VDVEVDGVIFGTQFTYVLPTITNITPLTGLSIGGTIITITGTNFAAPILLTIGGNKADDIVIVDSNTITAVIPRTYSNFLVDIILNSVTYINQFVYIPIYITNIVQNIGPDTFSTSLIGPYSGGAIIKITGKFSISNPPSITIGGNPAGIDFFGIEEEIFVIVPAGTSDTFADIVVYGITWGQKYHYVTPVVTSINPYTGPSAGGTTLLITGEHFAYPVSILFDSSPVIGVFINNTTIMVTTPAKSGPYTPIITISDIQTTLFTYFDTTYTILENIITIGVTPGFIITGDTTGLPLANAVIVGTSYPSYTIDSSTQITVIPPTGYISTVDVYLDFGSGPVFVGTVTYIDTIVTDIVPPIGSTTSITSIAIFSLYYPIHTYFSSNIAYVKIGLDYATDVTLTNFGIPGTPPYNTINCNAIGGIEGNQPILFQDTSLNTLLTSQIPFRYVGPPTISSFNPVNGLSVGGTAVIITGTNFVGLDYTTPVTVTVDGYPVQSIQMDSETQITITLPPQQLYSTNNPPIVITAIGGTYTKNFTYVNPTIISITPNNGPSTGGTPVTIKGTNFSGPLDVALGPNNMTSIVVVNSTTITAVTPSGSGIADLFVANMSLAYIFTYVNPYITGIVPPNGTTLGGTRIIITGIYFTGATNIQIDGVNATITVDSDTQITAITPLNTCLDICQVPLVIEWPNFIFATGFFTYDDRLLITSVFPTGGVTDGGTPIKITGVGFVNPIIITIGGRPLENIVVDPSNTFVTGTTPLGNVGRQPLIISSNSKIAESFFNYLPPLPQPPYTNRTCPGPPYNATNFTSGPIYDSLVSYAKNSPNYPWDTGVNVQDIYRSQQNTIYFNTLNQQTIDVKNANNTLISGGRLGNIPYPPFTSQAERLMYIQGQTLNAARNKITGQNPSVPMGVPCSTIYGIINS